MAVIETWLRQDLKGLVTVRSLQGQVFSLDNGGNLIGVKVTKDGRPVTLTGTVTGYCILSDGQTVTVTGSGSSGIQNGNEAYIVLPQLVYSVPGQISIVIKLTSGSVTTTLAACTGYVYRSRTSNEVVPPGTPIPDLATMEEVIRRATAATDAATAATVGAEKVDASMTKEGDVITIAVTDRDGNVMTETMTDTASDVSELKSSFEQLNDNVIVDSAGPAPIVSIADGADGMPMRKVEVAIEPVQDLHGYDAPWPAGGGKNLIPPIETKTASGVTFSQDGDYINISGTPSGTAYCVLFDGVLPAGTYTSNGVTGASNASYRTGLKIADATSWAYNSESQRTFTLEADSRVLIRLFVYAEYGTFDNFKVQYQLERGDTVTPWTPYSNICPISGWTGAKVTRTGKNLLDPSSCIAKRFINSNGAISSSGNWSVSDYIPVKGGQTYTLSGVTNISSIAYHAFYYPNKDFKSSVLARTNLPLTVPEDASFVRLSMNTETPDAVQFELGSTASGFSKFDGILSVQIPLGQTVYGGTLDVASGKLLVDRAITVLTGAEEWIREYRVNQTSLGAYYCTIIFSSFPETPNRSWDFISNLVRKTTASFVSMWVGSGRFQTNNLNFTICVAGPTTSEEYQQWLIDQNTAGHPLTIVREVNTPVEYQLTQTEIKTLLGVNNIWADAGNIAITYPADTKMYIDNRINSTRKLIAGIETGFVASKPYAVGDMLIIGDDLYKVASSIASGATITVGTNVTKTTVAEQLLALANA